MGFRFQRRVKLFPGVRLNFSKGGISTSIGIRGTSLTLGPRGAYVNLGIPGTGLSFRQRIAPNSDTRRAPSSVLPSPDSFSSPGLFPTDTGDGALTGDTIRSAPVGVMTSAGLDELKKLINEATERRIELIAAVSAAEKTLEQVRRRLRLAQSFIVRLFTQRAVPRLVEKTVAAESSLADVRQQLAGCSVEIDFSFDQPTLDSFEVLVSSFKALSGCQKIWDITSSVATNRIVQRTAATQTITRKPVSLRFSKSDVVDTKFKALCFTNANGNDIFIYPGFVMIPGRDDDFALIDVRELRINFSPSRFIEEERVPSDSEVTGYTWKKANKDGSPDRRFSANYQIPIAKYGEIEFRSSTGLWEVYQFSNYSAASAFHQSLIQYQKALSELAERSKNQSSAPFLALQGQSTEDAEVEPEAMPDTIPMASPQAAPRFLFLDWTVLLLLFVGLVGGGIYVKNHPDKLWTMVRSNMHVPSESYPEAPTMSVEPSITESKAAVQPPKDVVYVQKRSVNIRAEPSQSSPIVGNAKFGRKLHVFQRQGAWVQVGDDVPAGWIHQSLLVATPP